MSVPIKTELNMSAALANMQALAGRLRNLSPVHRQIGELLVDSTKRRFGDSTAPDGTAWKALSASSVAAFVAGFKGKGNFRKDGTTLSAAGERRKSNRKPLVGESKALSLTIFYEIGADGSLTVGSPMDYSAWHQFGTGTFAGGSAYRIAPKNKKALAWPGGANPVKSVMHPGIPARPFIGLSADDEAMMADKYAEYILEMPFVS
jgi:phage gpG-like protein